MGKTRRIFQGEAGKGPPLVPSTCFLLSALCKRRLGTLLLRQIPLPCHAIGFSAPTGIQAYAQRRTRSAEAHAPGSSSVGIVEEDLLDGIVADFNAGSYRACVEPLEALYFDGRPGLWHALDDLYPLQDPNRWDPLRQAVIGELETRGWRRRTPPRGIAFDIAD